MKTSKGANPALFGKGVLELNPALGILPSEKLAKEAHGASRMPASASESVLGGQVAKRGKRRREMNATEREFARILEARKRSGDILSYGYESLMLRWGDIEPQRYSPDFVVFEPSEEFGLARITLIEVKGAHCWKADLVRYKAACNAFPHLRFEFWTKTPTGWELTR